MEVIILSEHGYEEALFGLGFSRSITIDMTFEEFKDDAETYKQMLAVS